MSKINVCKICVNKDICIVKEDCIYWQTINQSPQLSDDVEMQLQHLETTLESIEWWSDYDCVNEIRQHIQEQASEIEDLQKFKDNEQPQLSDDVKFRLVDNNEDFKEYVVIHNGIVIDTINEDSYALFQAQASEIEGQKAITKEVSDTAMETIHEMNNKLNAIREVVKNTDILWKLDNEYLEQLREIKQILKENNNEEHIK